MISILKMNLTTEEPKIKEESIKEQIGQKRPVDSNDLLHDIPAKRIKIVDKSDEANERQKENSELSTDIKECTEPLIPQTSAFVPHSPKKRLEVPTNSKGKNQKSNKEKFIYGNYSQYYGYRNKDFKDVRLDVFEANRELFENKDVLDIGCNNGFITAAVAKRFNVKNIHGIDIDRGLVNQAIKNLIKSKKALPMENEARRQIRYPYNVQYIHGNYVLRDDVLLEIERPQFDVILCLSITKWIQLNFGDAGLKQVFRRIFRQLRSGGHLILEAQPFKNYRKRKYISEMARKNFEEINFFPNQFTEYLLSDDIGFKEVKLLGVPEHCAEGFKRPIQVFTKE